jgi:thermitase
MLALVVVAASFLHPPAGSGSARLALVPNDPYYSASTYRWSLARPGFEQAWSITSGDPSVVVAVVDTGVSPVEELRGALLPGRDVRAGSGDSVDVVGHGTEVASLIAARTNNGVGIAGACGRCSILPVRVVGADGTASAGDVASGIEWAADHGARIINVSLVFVQPADVLAAAVEHAQSRGALVVAAAGNEGQNRADYPAAFPGVVSVEAVDATDAPYPFSNRGGSIALAASGCAVAATRAASVAAACGTSVAAPFVSGAAALLAAAHPTADGAALASALESGADRVGDTRYGRLNVPRALAFSQARGDGDVAH